MRDLFQDCIALVFDMGNIGEYSAEFGTGRESEVALKVLHKRQESQDNGGHDSSCAVGSAS